MQHQDYSMFAEAWVNLLVPGRFSDAEKLISARCTYSYKNEMLRGPEILKAFMESHENAERTLDAIEYLPAAAKSFDREGVLVSVADKLFLNGKTHLYRDRLLVRMEDENGQWNVVEVKHLPIPEERAKLGEFLSQNPKRGDS